MKTIIVGVPTFKDANLELESCLEEFRKKNIHVTNLFFSKRAIQTSNCYIRFEPIALLEHLCGLRIDASFGFSKEDQCLLNRSHQPTDYNGTFLDYVYEVESVKR